eukprot:scaffold77994_cov82-Cyclotella_meneghiniana.AAC.2
MKLTLAFATLGWNTSTLISAFSPVESRLGATRQSSSPTSDVVSLSAEGFGSTTIKDRPTKSKEANTHKNIDMEHMSTEEVKKRLVDLIPKMTGKDEEYRAVEAYVNLLEDKYSPVQTIDFLNLAMSGDWQLLFSTNLTGAPNRKLRLRELVQNIKADEVDGFQGSLTNTAKWDLAEDGETFDANGNFVVKCSYKINQGSRMIVDLNDHELRPARGSKIPEDVPGLVGELKWS